MPKPDPNASDWSDLDLLTIDEAVERLDEEIAAVNARLAGLPDGPDRQAALHRLDLLGKARERASSGSKRPLYG
jgi:hypothetical protein